MAALIVALWSALSVADDESGRAVPAPPVWAYPVNPSVPQAQPSSAAKQLLGSDVTFTDAQVRDAFNVADWFPKDHELMPVIVRNGRKPSVRACAYCHLPNGLGRPENSSLAGLPASYIMQQMADFKRGLRKSAEPKMRAPAAMIEVAMAVSEEDVQIAAEYFSRLKPKPWIRVIESETAPKTKVVAGMLFPINGGGTEPIGQRIIETPEDAERTDLRDPRSGFVAYVPPGSIKKGEELVSGRATSQTTQCALCHGSDLKGTENAPRLANVSPSYIVRQLYDMKYGARSGAGTAQMKDVVSKLTEADMIAIAAYTASRAP